MAHAHANRRIRSRMTALSGTLLVMIGLGASTSLNISGNARSAPLWHEVSLVISSPGGAELDRKVGLPRSLGHAGFSDHDLCRRNDDPTPVDPCNGR